ncbi:MAG: metallophosphoesterase, partial [Candidatus Bathyarchaeia archaeon]
MSALRPLLIIAILIAASGFTSDILGEYLGPIDYKGYLVFDYPEGDNPINNIVFTVDSTLADNLIIVSVLSIWSYSYDSPVLTLSGGSVGPGGSVSVTVSLNKYFEDGEYSVSSVGTTTAGEVSQASGPLLVGELYLLNFIGMASAYRFPLAGLVIGLVFLELFLSGRKRAGVPVPVDGKLGEDDKVKLHDDKGPTISTKDKEDELPSTRTREQGSTQRRHRNGGSGTITNDDDGDDPRDIPPPTIYGEEIEVDPIVCPVYIVSDFHIGSNKSGPGQVDKKLSNDMDKKTLENFLKWLKLVEKDAEGYDHYDVVMNGDFLDLWQATRPKDDDYQKRLEDILETNQVDILEENQDSNPTSKNFFSKLGKFIINNSPRCRFYYVIGNHDDALYSGNHEGDLKFGEGNSFNSLRNMVTGKLRNGDTSLMSFAMNRQYTNANYKLYVEHGHQHDSTNM